MKQLLIAPQGKPLARVSQFWGLFFSGPRNSKGRHGFLLATCLATTLSPVRGISTVQSFHCKTQTPGCLGSTLPG